MGGGLMQLVAYGAQDVYLTGNPQITFFKVVYKRHTNFSIEPIEQTFSGNAGFGKKANVQITRNGDLITKMYLRVELPAVNVSTLNLDAVDSKVTQFAWCRKLGHALISTVELEIGGSRIDKHYGNWLNIWYELTHEAGQEDGYAHMIGDTPELCNLSSPNASGLVKNGATLYIPLQFWFCRNNGLALPLIALQYHEVRVYFEFSPLNECCVRSPNLNSKLRSLGIDFQNASLLVDYIYLDTEERRRFAQVSHEYLIEQLQTTGEDAVTSNSYKGKLNFNHPSKALFWGLRCGQYRNDRSFMVYEPFNWENALKDAAEKLIRGQYKYNDDGTLDTCECTDPDFDEVSIPVFVDKATGELDSTGDSTSNIYKRKSDLDYVICGVGTARVDLKKLVTGNAVFYKETGKTYVHHVNIVTNDLTIAELSVSVDRLTVDNRAAWIKNFDVVVWQHDNYGLYIDGSVNPVQTGKLQLNGHDRFDVLDGNYFNYVQPYQHFHNTPADGVNVYSFALKPIEHQPSGAANFSRIDTAELFLTFQKINCFGKDEFRETLDSETKIEVLTVNYNVLRIMSGMGGLAYSN
jgi:hypothetical protein